MARIVLVLVCGALVFVLVSKFAPHFLETYVPAAAGFLRTETAPDETDSKAASTKKKTTPSKLKSGTTARSSAATSEAPAPAGLGNVPSPVTGDPQAIEAAGSQRHIARVTAENATLYLTNTSGGPVVGRLTKGAVVETVFVVSSAGQNWTYVSASDRQVAGFLKSEALAKPKTADQPSR